MVMSILFSYGPQDTGRTVGPPDFAPFFDQYAQALSPWSPDSSHFCFATADGKVCVQSVEGATASLDASRSALGAQLGMVQLAPDAEVVDAPDADLVVWSPC